MNRMQKTPKYLSKLSASFITLIVMANIIAAILSGANKGNYLVINFLLNGFLFFLYRLRLSLLVNSNWLAVKKEAMYINFPVSIGLSFLSFFLLLLSNILIIYVVNKEALNATFVMSMFLSAITMLLPSIILLAYMNLIVPAFVIPSFEQKDRKRKSDFIIIILFILYLILCGYLFTNNPFEKKIEQKDKYRAIKLPLQYSREYLKYTDLSENTKQQLQKQRVVVPFLYSADGFKVSDYYEAEAFCKSMNAEVPSHLEIYNIIFHRFDILGENYYWTKDFAGKNNLVLHFKNMKYEIIKKPENVKPILYCTAKTHTNYKLVDPRYFYRIKPIEIETEKVEIPKTPFEMGKKVLTPEKMVFPKKNIELKQQELQQKQDYVQEELKHVHFSVKHVTDDYMQDLLSQGYKYDTQLKVNPYDEIEESMISRRLNRDINKKEIRLCDYPFTKYGNLTIQDEMQIWKQSFCSPAFELISTTPMLKTRYEKDTYCYMQGGRVPNLPELNGILKSLGIKNVGTKYWTNTNIIDHSNDSKSAIAMYYADNRFIQVEPIGQNNHTQAYTYCIKNSKNPSQIISNYKSRFNGYDGKNYAKSTCSNCKYYEVPDTVLINN